MRRWEDAKVLHLTHHVTGQGVQVVQRLDLVAEELDPDGQFLVRRDDLDGVAADPEAAAGETHVVAGVLHVDEQPQQRIPVDLLADVQMNRTVEI